MYPITSIAFWKFQTPSGFRCYGCGSSSANDYTTRVLFFSITVICITEHAWRHSKPKLHSQCAHSPFLILIQSPSMWHVRKDKNVPDSSVHKLVSLHQSNNSRDVPPIQTTPTNPDVVCRGNLPISTSHILNCGASGHLWKHLAFLLPIITVSRKSACLYRPTFSVLRTLDTTEMTINHSSIGMSKMMLN